MGASHGGFILASYLMAAAVLAGLTLRVLLDHRALKGQLARLERRGARRRSAKVADGTPHERSHCPR